MNAVRSWGLYVCVCASTVAQAVPQVIVSENFDSPTLPATFLIGAQSGGSVQISTDANLNYKGSAGSLKGVYPANAAGGNYIWATFMTTNLGLSDVYVEFWAKQPDSIKRGLKFLKIFGKVVDNTYANTTFAPDYASGVFKSVSFGDGTSTSNDTTNVLRFDGTYPEWMGRSYGTAIISTPQKKAFDSTEWGTGWHHFRIHCKFNSGTTADNEVADGEYYVEIDDKVYVDVKKVFNRHWSNGPIDKIEFFGWTQISGTSPSFEIWYDDITISTGGFVPRTPSPSPPLLQVQ